MGFPMKVILTDDTGLDFFRGFLAPNMLAWSPVGLGAMMSSSMTALPRLDSVGTQNVSSVAN